MSYAFYIGHNLTADGNAYLAGYGDEPSSHWLELVPRQQHASDVTITVGVTPAAMMPGELSEIPQAPETARHLRVSYTYYRGVPAPLTNGGVNEYGVAVRDVWSTSAEHLQALTPTNQTGPNYSDLARIVLERAKTAREGVEIIGQLIAEYGYSTYGGNSHFIADHNEGWVVIEFAGGAGLWVAERVGPDDIRVSRPGYIGEIPLDFATHPDFAGPPHLTQFAIDRGWFDPTDATTFDINQIYGDGKGLWEGQAWIDAQLRELAARPEKISIQDVMWAVRTPTLTSDTAGYGQVVPLQKDQPALLQTLWHTASAATAAPFAPVFIGNTCIPVEYQKHRYLTVSEEALFMDDRKGIDGISSVPQATEAHRSAFRVAKRLLYHVFMQHEEMLTEVTNLLVGFEQKSLTEICAIEKAAIVLFAAKDSEAGQQLLTYFSTTELSKSLQLVETITAYLEARATFTEVPNATIRSPKQLW